MKKNSKYKQRIYKQELARYKNLNGFSYEEVYPSVLER